MIFMGDGDKFPELIFGLVGAIGTNLELVAENLAESLQAAGYHAAPPIRLSALIRALNSPWSDLPNRDDPDYYDKAMDAGNDLREKLQRNDAVAALAIANISDLRKEEEAKGLRMKRAYILHSLKRPEEIKLLREVYGSTFFVISAYAPRVLHVLTGWRPN